MATRVVDENKYHSYGQHWRLAFDIAINTVSIIFIYFFISIIFIYFLVSLN